MIVRSDRCVKSKCTAIGGISPQPLGGTLTPLIPLSLRACKGEGEEKTEGSACAMAQALPSSLVLGGEKKERKNGRDGCAASTSAFSSVLERRGFRVGGGVMGESRVQGTHKGHPYREGTPRSPHPGI